MFHSNVNPSLSMTTFQNLKKREKYLCVISVISLPRVDLTGCCSSCLAGYSISHKTLFVLTFSAGPTSHCPATLPPIPSGTICLHFLVIYLIHIGGRPQAVFHVLPYTFPAARSWAWWCKPSPTTPVSQKKVMKSGCWSNLGIWAFFFCLGEVLNFH